MSLAPEAQAHSRSDEGERCRICGGARLSAAGEVNGYRFLECSNCAFVFAPQIGADTLRSLYEEGFHGIEEGAPAVGWANTEFLKPAFDRLPEESLKILDYGCGTSVVPAILRAQGHRVIAIDVAPPARDHPDRITGSVDDLAGCSFNLVYSFQVFEHLPNPRPTFDRLLEMTRPGGLLLIHTDMETPEREGGLQDWWYATPPDHCSFYRPATFEKMIEKRPATIEWSDPKTVLIRKG